MKEQERKYKLDSRDKLEKFCESKIKTTMIGAISQLEKEFSRELADPEFAARFNRIREGILDQGNNQIRSLKAELVKYEVELLRYYIEMRTL